MYIYSKCVIFRKNGRLCYGYPMDMLWVSYGVGSKLSRNRLDVGSRDMGYGRRGMGKKERTEIHKEQKGKNTNKKKRLLLPSR